jgi:hypothetical protein
MRFYFMISLAVVFNSTSTFASYRVYQLRLRHFDQTAKKKMSEVVVTTMDSEQYQSFHGGSNLMKVEMLDTWYCPGDTSHKKYCKKPKEPIDRGPASLDHPKRINLPLNLQPVIP